MMRVSSGRDHALFDVSADLLSLGPERPGGPKLRLADRRSDKAAALIDRHGPRDLIRACGAFIRRDSLYPDPVTVFENAEIRLAAFALALDDGE
jgi:hypothetical protein